MMEQIKIYKRKKEAVKFISLSCYLFIYFSFSSNIFMRAKQKLFDWATY